MKTVVLGTAGHIDHGKTALVRALSGIDTDRLPEEKARGITIDLGFANFHIGDVGFAIVDVPGHEDFIRNMLAGVTGIDAVLLTIAADEGVMPQTREHVAILDLLDVRRGVAVVTKSDLADPDWLQLVSEDVRTLLRGTSLEGAPVVAVSALTGAGMDELKQSILAQTTEADVRSADDLFRMPIDRVFTVRGTGTVVTGTVWSGSLNTGTALEVLPTGGHARVRGIQVHGADMPAAAAGKRAAIALSGIEKSAVSRGDVVVTGDAWRPTRMLTVRARVIADSTWSLGMRQRVRVHLGTAEVLARAVLLDKPAIDPGDEGWIQLRLEAPVIARVGDRIVLRSYSPVTTIGGGVIVEIADAKRTRITDTEAAHFSTVAGDDATAAILAFLQTRNKEGATLAELSVNTPVGPGRVREAVTAIGDAVVSIEDRMFARDVVDRGVNDLMHALDELHRQQPLRAAVDLGVLRGALRGQPQALTDHSINRAAEQGQLVVREGLVRQASFEPTLSVRQAALKDAIYEKVRAASLAPPTASELGTALGAPADVLALLKLLAQEGRLVAISPDLYVEAGALEAARRRTRAELAGPVKLGAADFKAALPVSRKHLIPLLEYFDRTGVTAREGDLRVVLPASGNS